MVCAMGFPISLSLSLCSETIARVTGGMKVKADRDEVHVHVYTCVDVCTVLHVLCTCTAYCMLHCGVQGCGCEGSPFGLCDPGMYM